MNNILHGHCKQEWLWLSLSEFRLVWQRNKCAIDMDNVINARKGIWTEYYGTQLTLYSFYISMDSFLIFMVYNLATQSGVNCPGASPSPESLLKVAELSGPSYRTWVTIFILPWTLPTCIQLRFENRWFIRRECQIILMNHTWFCLLVFMYRD